MLANVQGERVEANEVFRQFQNESKSFVEIEHLVSHKTTIPYTHVLAASSPYSTFCSWLWKDDRQFYKLVARACGIHGTNQGAIEGAIDAHLEKVWNLIKNAYSELDGNKKHRKEGDTLRIFLLPEWALGRRYPADGTDFSPPLDFAEMQYIIFGLEKKMQKSGLDFSDWLIVPGSIYWGFKISHLAFNNVIYKYAVFNTAPIYYGGRFVWAHNKHLQADNMHSSEQWGYDLVQLFQGRPGCTVYDGGGARVCGSVEFAKAVAQANGASAGEALQKWGLQQPAYAILVNGLVVGLDICVDHRYMEGIDRLKKLGFADMFDIQLLIASGMSFNVPEENDGRLSLTLRKQGLAISSDGVQGPAATQLFMSLSDDGHGVTKQGQLVKIQVDLQRHFQEVDAVLLNSWTQGCEQDWMDTANKAYCTNCQTSAGRQKFVREYGSKGARVPGFCKAETANHNILKVWRLTRLKSKSPSATRSKNSHPPTNVSPQTSSSSSTQMQMPRPTRTPSQTRTIQLVVNVAMDA